MVVASIFQVFIVKPIFNLLILIYALLPGHDFGLAIILFTITVRMLMLPLVRRQLHQAKVMRKLQPEIKRIKTETKGDKRKEQLMIMELYKERGISTFGSLGTIVVQFIILIGLYSGLNHLVRNSRAIVDNAYAWIGDLGWLQTLHADIGRFDQSLLGIVDLTKAAIDKGNGIYVPALILVTLSAAIQYMTSKQLLPKSDDARSLRQILREAGSGKASDQTEVSTAVSGMMVYLIPGMVFLFTVRLPSALSLYWFIGGVVAYVQQARILQEDEQEMEMAADKSNADIIEGEIVQKAVQTTTRKKTPTKKKRKRR